MSRSGVSFSHTRCGELTLPVARAAVDAAVAYAYREELQVSIAVLDAGGHLLAFARLSGTPWHSIDLAIEKARTSASFALPSSTLGDMIDNASERVRMNLLQRPDIVALGGAFPLRIDGRLVGAIGVSGASEEEDIDCAQAGCAVICSLTETEFTAEFSGAPL